MKPLLPALKVLSVKVAACANPLQEPSPTQYPIHIIYKLSKGILCQSYRFWRLNFINLVHL